MAEQLDLNHGYYYQFLNNPQKQCYDALLTHMRQFETKFSLDPVSQADYLIANRAVLDDHPELPAPSRERGDLLAALLALPEKFKTSMFLYYYWSTVARHWTNMSACCLLSVSGGSRRSVCWPEHPVKTCCS